MITIYSISDPETGVVFYVGKTVNFEVRKSQHEHLSHNEVVRDKMADYKAIGLDAIFEVLEICTASETPIIEAKWINHFDALGIDLCNKYFVKTNETDSSERMKDYILKNDTFHMSWLAKQMWPNNKNANSYLSSKLNNYGNMRFTQKDAILAKRAIVELGQKLISLSEKP